MWRMMCRMTGRSPGASTRGALDQTLAICAAMLLLAISASAAFALSESPAGGSSPTTAGAPPVSVAPPSAAPATKIVPSDEIAPPEGAGEETAPAEEGAGGTTGTPPAKPRVHHHHVASRPPEVEPATARLRVTQNGWIYAGPSKSSKKIEKNTVGKFVNVTGSTRYYLQASLKNGETGYIPIGDVELVRPTDKIFMLTQDAAVLEAPNHWARKLAEVHRSHNVHVIGLALNYMQIRMKSGLTGFIPVSALQ
jgi:hypothetical protein